MLNFRSRSLFLGPLSITLTISMLLISAKSWSQTHYTMTVVKEAWVGNGSSQPNSEPLSCISANKISQALSRMVSHSQHGQKPIKLLDINSNSALFAIQNTDDFHLNTVSLWVQIKNQKKLAFFQISEIEMYEYTLPKVNLNNGVLTVEATTMTVDPTNDNENFKVPNTIGRLYQTIKVGQVLPNALQLNILTCK